MLIKQPQRVWPSPLYADFPRSEYDSRFARARKYMAEQKIDVLVLWDPVNIRYFSGFQSLHWTAMSIQPAVVLLPLEKDPVIVVPDFFSQVAEGYTYIKDIRLLAKPHVTKNIRQIPVDVAETVKELGCGRGRVGIEAGALGGMAIPRPVNDIDRFRGALDGATFVEAADLIWKCRMIKSPSEVEALRKASQAVARAYGEVVANFELGMSERDAGNLIRHAILEYTEDCAPPIATSSSRRVVMPDTPSFYDEVNLSIGDRLVFEPLPTYKGYYGSCCRCFQIGPLPDVALKKAEAVDRAQAAAIAAIKPGLQTKVIMDVVAESLRADGIEPTIEVAGHGVGLSPHEPPMIAEEEEAVFQEGMVMAVEVWVVDWKGDFSKLTGIVPEVFGNEDYVVVTKDGCDQLADFRKDIRNLPYEGTLV
ncbi:MAG: Xaa-Pro peptidase family protein [bacterium]